MGSVSGAIKLFLVVSLLGFLATSSAAEFQIDDFSVSEEELEQSEEAEHTIQAEIGSGDSSEFEIELIDSDSNPVEIIEAAEVVDEQPAEVISPDEGDEPQTSIEFKLEQEYDTSEDLEITVTLDTSNQEAGVYSYQYEDIETEFEISPVLQDFEASVEGDFIVDDNSVHQGNRLGVELSDAVDKAGDTFEEEVNVQFDRPDRQDQEDTVVEFDSDGEADFSYLPASDSEDLEAQDYGPKQITTPDHEAEAEIEFTILQTVDDFSISSVGDISQGDPLKVNVEDAIDTVEDPISREVTLSIDSIDGENPTFQEEFEDGEAQSVEILSQDKTSEIESGHYNEIGATASHPGDITTTREFSVFVDQTLNHSTVEFASYEEPVPVSYYETINFDLVGAVDLVEDPFNGVPDEEIALDVADLRFFEDSHESHTIQPEFSDGVAENTKLLTEEQVSDLEGQQGSEIILQDTIEGESGRKDSLKISIPAYDVDPESWTAISAPFEVENVEMTAPIETIDEFDLEEGENTTLTDSEETEYLLEIFEVNTTHAEVEIEGAMVVFEEGQHITLDDEFTRLKLEETYLLDSDQGVAVFGLESPKISDWGEHQKQILKYDQTTPGVIEWEVVDEEEVFSNPQVGYFVTGYDKIFLESQSQLPEAGVTVEEGWNFVGAYDNTELGELRGEGMLLRNLFTGLEDAADSVVYPERNLLTDPAHFTQVRDWEGEREEEAFREGAYWFHIVDGPVSLTPPQPGAE